MWGSFGVFGLGFRETVIAISDSRMQFAVNLGRIGSSVQGALISIAVLATQAITFYRITSLFRILRSQREIAERSTGSTTVNTTA